MPVPKRGRFLLRQRQKRSPTPKKRVQGEFLALRATLLKKKIKPLILRVINATRKGITTKVAVACFREYPKRLVLLTGEPIPNLLLYDSANKERFVVLIGKPGARMASGTKGLMHIDIIDRGRPFANVYTELIAERREKGIGTELLKLAEEIVAENTSVRELRATTKNPLAKKTCINAGWEKVGGDMGYVTYRKVLKR